ncbi:hypothetical protein FDP41_008739 [Naegleria fowleri]|uniref:Uncharacterized protein n=1 Tax=Naegleria fowleri TaxID=5763 RepID=A0A6A5BGE8_NAEFO|nr:uncharacterized protein FDP41_008739 [Naegleria fowleri]KAF0973075.1 hypothetical protein FDP41_008739 [Naegleria fowleri]
MSSPSTLAPQHSDVDPPLIIEPSSDNNKLSKHNSKQDLSPATNNNNNNATTTTTQNNAESSSSPPPQQQPPTTTTSSSIDSNNTSSVAATTSPQVSASTDEKKKVSFGKRAKNLIGKFFGQETEEERLEREQLMIIQKEEARRKKKDLLLGASFYDDYHGGVLDQSEFFNSWKAHSVDHEDVEYNAKVSELKSNAVEEKQEPQKKEESEDEHLTDDDFSDDSEEDSDNGESKNQTFMVSQENEYVQRFIQERREMQSKFTVGEVDRLKLYGNIVDYTMSSVESSEISDRILHVIAYRDRIMFADEYDHLIEVKFDKRKELTGYIVKKIFLTIPHAYECYVVLENPSQQTYVHYVIDIDRVRFEQSDAENKEPLTFDIYKFDPKISGSSPQKPAFDGSNYMTAVGFPHSVVQDDIMTRKIFFMAVSPGNIIYKVDFNVDGEEYDYAINFKKGIDKVTCEEVYNMDALYNEKQIIVHSHRQGFSIDSIEFAEVKEMNEFMVFISSVAGVAVFTGSGEITDIFDRYGPEQSMTPAFRNFDEEEQLVDFDKPKGFYRSILKVYDSTCFACITSKFIAFGRIYNDAQKTLDRAGRLAHKNPNDVPVDIELNNFHLFVCYKDEFCVIMQPAYLPPSNSRYSLLSKHVVTVRLINTLGVKLDRSIIDKSREESNESIYVYSSSKLFRVSISDQAKGFWRIFLDAALEIEDQDMERIKSEYFKKALHLSALFDMNSEENTMAIFSAKADHHFKKGDYNTAALDYARTNRNFEEIAMKFMEADPEDKKNGLYNYLYYMLHRYKNDKKKMEECPESVILAVWIVELLCFKMNQQRHIMGKFITVACSEEQYKEQLNEKSKAEQQLHRIKTVLRKFTYNKKELLAKAKDIVYNIFLSNNFVREFLFFATSIGDYLTIIQHCVTMAKSSEYENNHSKELSYYETAYTILNNFCTEPHAFDKNNDETAPQNQIWYGYTPLLMNYEKRDEIVKSFKRLQFLNPRDLVPSILKYDQIMRSGPTRRRSMRQDESQVLDYLKWCIEDQKNENRTVHDLFVYLLVNNRNTELLETFLKETKESENVYFTKEYALRLAVEGRKWTACVLLYRLLELYEEAVDLALDSKVNKVKLAEETVSQYVEDPELKKKLAIKIVKHYIKEENYRKALDLISDFNDVLLLDDVIKYFPPKVQLEEVIKDVESILDVYSFQNNKVEVQMRDATNDAELIRNELSSMNVYHDIDYDDICERCKSRVLLPNMNDPQDRKNFFFYVFPSGQKFHLNCLYRINKHQLENQLIAIDERAIEAGRKEATQNHLKLFREKKFKKQKKLEKLLRASDMAEKESEISKYQFKIKMLDNTINEIKQGKFQFTTIEAIYTPEELKQRNTLLEKIQKLKEIYENWHKARLELAEALNDGSEKTQLYWQLEFKNARKQLDDILGKSCPTDGPTVVAETTIPFITDEERMNNEFVV